MTLNDIKTSIDILNALINSSDEKKSQLLTIEADVITLTNNNIIDIQEETYSDGITCYSIGYKSCNMDLIYQNNGGTISLIDKKPKNLSLLHTDNYRTFVRFGEIKF